jgi:hypothetical protein
MTAFDQVDPVANGIADRSKRTLMDGDREPAWLEHDECKAAGESKATFDRTYTRKIPYQANPPCP